MTDALTEGRVRAVRYGMAAVMLFGAIYYVVASWHWAMLVDSPIMHYVNFLMAHGMKPYSEITDNNFPGSYMTESLAMHVFGGSDLAWRMFEFFLLALLTGAMVVIARPYDWLAGVFAGGMFLLLHGSQGPVVAVEREQEMTALLMVGYAAMFCAVRWRRPALMGLMGFAAAMAGSIKPTVAPLVLVLVAIVAVVLRRRGVRALPYVLWAGAGIAVALALNVGFLLVHHAMGDFLYTQRVITPYYAGLNREPVGMLLRQLIAPTTGVLMLGAVVLALVKRGWDWERWTLVLAAAVGFVSYMTQGKGFVHHRYMMLTFVFLLIGIEALTALRRPGWMRWAATTMIVFALAVPLPRYVKRIHEQKDTSELTTNLESDLTALGGTSGLQRQVQCLDLVYGCLNALYHLQLVENTGFTGDLLVLSPKSGPAVEYHRAMWMKAAVQDPAAVLVVTNEYFEGKNGYFKLDYWPEYRRFLDANYIEVVERSFPNDIGITSPPILGDAPLGYRIYVRNNSPLLSEAKARLAGGA